ncbi:MAG: ABC transporter substrate-binding protein [Methylocella sp.]
MRRTIIAVALAGLLPCVANAQEPIRIGFISTFSGPQGVLGQELLDGFKLGLRHVGGKLGGRPVELIQGDDQAKPDVGRQVADMMIERNRVHIITGINFSNVLLALAKPSLDAGAFVISVNAGPSQYAGSQCHPHFFAAAFQNDTMTGPMGIYLTKQGAQNIYVMAANYPAGKDMVAGFKREFKGTLAGEVYTTFGQLDYAAEISELRSKNPGGVFFFYPGGMGINFIKQFAQAGLKDQIPMYVGGGVVDQTILPAVGDAAIGIRAVANWSEFLDNPASRKFASDFETEHHRIPSPYAAGAYDTVLMLEAALKSIGGQIENKEAFRQSLENVKFDSVRGFFRFNTNHYPIQNFYLTEIMKDAKGRVVAGLRDVIVREYADPDVSQCKMPAEG